jgi:hypothetical protein
LVLPQTPSKTVPENPTPKTFWRSKVNMLANELICQKLLNVGLLSLNWRVWLFDARYITAPTSLVNFI